MKKFFTNIKNWFWSPITSKSKTKSIFVLLCTLFFVTMLFALFTHWALCFIPILILLLLLYVAKLPIKQEKENNNITKKGGFYGKNKK